MRAVPGSAKEPQLAQKVPNWGRERAEVANPASLASRRHNMENFGFTYEPITIGAGCVLGERSSLMGHSTMQDRAQLMPMAQAMKGMTLLAATRSAGMLAATRSAGNPANTVRPSDAWWAPLRRDLVPLRQIVVEHPPDAVSHGLDADGGGPGRPQEEGSAA